MLCWRTHLQCNVFNFNELVLNLPLVSIFLFVVSKKVTAHKSQRSKHQGERSSQSPDFFMITLSQKKCLFNTVIVKGFITDQEIFF